MGASSASDHQEGLILNSSRDLDELRLEEDSISYFSVSDLGVLTR